MSCKKSGYILLLTLMILSISTIVVAQIFYQGRLFNAFVPLVIEKEKARQLALAGVSIAIAQLSLEDSYFKKAQEDGPRNNVPGGVTWQLVIPL